ncbi:MAG: hypothetical protein KAT17_01005, partial [Candidatus Aminicenantes bacterium]|nr:hypothetical protein [Candidatus Aminicenantes bacterium]
IPQKTHMELECEIRGNNKVYFVLFNHKEKAALVHGIEIKEVKLPDFKKIPEIKAMSEKFKYSQELITILEGAAAYCHELKQAGFHYICKEKVVESLSIFEPSTVSDISLYENRASERDMMNRSQPKLGFKRRLVNKYLFDYQIIKDEKGIKEQRILLSKQKKKVKKENTGLKIKAFLTEKAVFAPVTLLANERQKFYEFRFVKYEKLKGVRCAVIEVLPRSKSNAQFIYGQVWIDTSDYSIVKIKANPRSIVGYNKLQYIARSLGSKLFLSLEISFNKIYQGIRFPDSVVLSELYKGGIQIYRKIGPKGWERNRTEYSYKDYQFFVVGLKVSAESED